MELIERVSALEANEKTIFKRLDNVDEKADSIHKLAESIAVLAKSMQNVDEKVDSIDKRLGDIEKRPATFWDKLIFALIGAAASGFVAWILSR
jgi:tetrahydromethanopterin S-methyltransferase subunit G